VRLSAGTVVLRGKFIGRHHAHWGALGSLLVLAVDLVVVWVLVVTGRSSVLAEVIAVTAAG